MMIRRVLGYYLCFEAGMQTLTAIDHGTFGNIILASIFILISVMWLTPIFPHSEEDGGN